MPSCNDIGKAKDDLLKECSRRKWPFWSFLPFSICFIRVFFFDGREMCENLCWKSFPDIMSPFVEDNEEKQVEVDFTASPQLITQRGGSEIVDIGDLLQQLTETLDLSSVLHIKIKILTKDLPLYSLVLFLPRLKKLDLDGSNLDSLRELGPEMPSLEILRVGKCRLHSLDGILAFRNLKEFVANSNYITTIGFMGQLERLQQIDLEKNSIPNWKSLSFLRDCHDLRVLRFKGNPGANLPGYVQNIRNSIPQLKVLDDINLDADVIISFEEVKKEPETNKKVKPREKIMDIFSENLIAELSNTKNRSRSKADSAEPAKSVPEKMLEDAITWRQMFKEHLKKKRENSQ